MSDQVQELIAELEAADRALTEVHLRDFTLSQSPPVDFEALSAQKRAAALAGIQGFRPLARRKALQQADVEAIEEAAKLNRENSRTNPLDCLAELDFRCASVDGSVATIIGTFGSPDIVPERVKSTTPSGKTTTKKRTKTERNAVYVEALGSVVLAAVKITFAAVPAVDRVRVAVVSDNSLPDALFTGTFPRSFLTDIDWASIEPGEEILFADNAQLQRKGVAQEVVPVPIKDEALAGAINDRRHP